MADRRHRAAAALGVSTLSFGAYWLTHGSGPYWQDAGLFHAGLRLGGGLAPPGYPLYVLLGRPFVALFGAALPGRPFAEAVNTFSALWASLAAGLVTLCCLLLLTPGVRVFADPVAPGRVGAPDPPGRSLSPSAWVAAVLAGLMAGVSYSLWFQALTAEAYTLNAFFAVLVLFLLLSLGAEGRLGRRPSVLQRRLTVALFVAHGLSCGNHPATVMFVPVLALFVWRERAALADRRLVLSVFVAYGLAGLLPYAYLPWAARAHPTLLSSQLGTFRGLVDYVTGAQWTSHEASYGWAWSRLAAFPAQLFAELFVVGILGAVLGATRLAREQRGLVPYLALFLAVAWLLPTVYLQGGEYDFWFLPLYMALFVLAGVGCHALLERAAGGTGGSLRLAVATGILLAGALGPALAVNAPLVDRREDFVAEDFGRNLFRHVAPNGVLFASSDQECALTTYEDAVVGFRPDVVLIHVPVLGPPWVAHYLASRYPSLRVPDELQRGPVRSADEVVGALLLANLGERAFYISKRPRVALPDGLAWVPAGGLWRLDARRPPAVDPADWKYVYRNERPFDRPARDHCPQKPIDPVTGETLPLSATRREPYTAQVRRFHMQAWKNLGDWQLSRDAFGEAAEAYRKVLALEPGLDHPALFLSLGKALFALDRNEDALAYLERAAGRLDPRASAEALLYIGQILAARGQLEKARDAFRSARGLSPELWGQYAPWLREKGYVDGGE